MDEVVIKTPSAPMLYNPYWPNAPLKTKVMNRVTTFRNLRYIEKHLKDFRSYKLQD